MPLLIENPTANLGVTLKKAAALDGVALSPGQTISGKVQSVQSDGTVTLNLAGKTVEAVTEVPLAAGQEINLEVIGRIDGRLYLKLSGEPATAVSVEPQQLAAQLASPRISIPNLNQTDLVSALLENQLPVTDKNLAALSRVVTVLGRSVDDLGNTAVDTGGINPSAKSEPVLDLKLGGFILAAGLKDQPEVWPVLKDYFQQPANLGASLEKLIQGLSSLAPAVPASAAAEVMTPPVSGAPVVSAPDTSAAIIVSDSNSQPAAANLVQNQGVGGTGIPGQPALTAQLSDGSTNPAPQSIVITSEFSRPETTEMNAQVLPVSQEAPGVLPEQPTVGSDKSIQPESLNQTQTQTQTQVQVPNQSQNLVQNQISNQALIQSVKLASDEGQTQPASATGLTSAGLLNGTESSSTIPGSAVLPPAESSLLTGSSSLMVTEPAVNAGKPAASAELELYGQLLTDLLGASGQGSTSADRVSTPMSALIELINQKGQPIDSEEIKNQLHEWLSIQKPLAQLLNLVKTEIGKEDVAKLLMQNKLVELGQAVNSSLHEVIGQQVINTVDKSQPTLPNYYYFSWPLQSQNQEQQAELRVYQQKGRNQPLDMNDLYLVFCLQTPNLGVNRFDIHLRQKKMEFRITMEKAGAVSMVQEAWPELAQRLDQLGFQADLMECRSGTPEQLRPQPEAKANLESLRRIDVLV